MMILIPLYELLIEIPSCFLSAVSYPTHSPCQGSHWVTVKNSNPLYYLNPHLISALVCRPVERD